MATSVKIDLHCESSHHHHHDQNSSWLLLSLFCSSHTYFQKYYNSSWLPRCAPVEQYAICTIKNNVIQIITIKIPVGPLSVRLLGDDEPLSAGRRHEARCQVAFIVIVIMIMIMIIMMIILITIMIIYDNDVDDDKGGWSATTSISDLVERWKAASRKRHRTCERISFKAVKRKYSDIT